MVNLLDHFKFGNRICMLFPIYGYDLDVVLPVLGSLPEFAVKIIIKTLNEAIADLNNKSLVHGDIKLRNIFLKRANPTLREAIKSFLQRVNFNSHSYNTAKNGKQLMKFWKSYETMCSIISLTL